MLAVDPTSRGYAFCVLEGPNRLIDWGTRTARKDKEWECLSKLGQLIEELQPDLVVVEDCGKPGSRRCARVRELVGAFVELAKQRKVKTARVSRREVEATFADSGARSKQEIAAAIAKRFPELGPHLPTPRKLWTSEDCRMNIFDAVRMVLSVFDCTRR